MSSEVLPTSLPKQSSSYSSAALDFENKHRIEPVFDSPRMSRRSLRLTTGHFSDDSFLDTSSHSVSYSGGSKTYRESKTLKSRTASKPSSCLTPRKTQVNSSLLLGHNSFQSSHLDSSLMSTVLDESSIQEKTFMDGWGLDEDGDPKGADATLILANGDINTAQTQTTMVNGYTCNDCSILSERKGVLTTYSSSSSSTAAGHAAAGHAAAGHAPAGHTTASTVYCRDKTKKHKSGVLQLVRDKCCGSLAGAKASVCSLVMLLIQNILVKIGYEAKAHSSYCGSMNVKELMTGDGHLNLNGSLCDDCKGKQHLQMQSAHKQSSRSTRVARTMWHVVACAGYYLFQAVRTIASAGWFVTKKLLSVLWVAVVSPGKAANGAFWWLGTGWYQLVTLMSLLNVFILTRCLPKLYKLLLLLIPLFLFLGWWYWGPSGLLSFLPALMQSEGEAESEIFPTPSSLDHGTAGHTDHPHPSAEGVSGSFDAERVAQLERRLALLWDSHTKSSRQGEERHGEVLGLYHSLQERLAQASNKEALSLWISSLFEERLAHLKEDLQQDRAETEKNQDGYLALHQSHESRLADLERLLQIVASKTEELQHRQDSATPAAVSEGSEDQGLLLSEVKRLELELNRIKADLLGVKSCQGKCDRLDSLQDTVEAQVRDSVKMLIYGSRQAEMPESLLQWLSSQYVQQSDLQAVLLSLERSILRNISRHSGHGKVMPSTQVVTNAVHHAGVTGMSEEQVRVIVHNALKLYSQDRTGLVDYALESGGGSILSTRCSETYETKTALMSLFGVPLWYFSQSPRVVIQPDVYPGNCWAFKGSQGYLVIRLSLTILPTSFSLEHIPKALSPTGNITSAPRDFTVYGLEDEYQEEGKLLGQYTYSEDGESLQTFAVTEQNEKAYQIIEIRVLSNWGHPEYTCLYRFRVHGEPHQP
ncbi:SUN domain-containing protein 1 isoform X3 [Amia ocellicauda]|uniref:SUN domain-containing protein 1 isoform X3 n=1 Tax=Amia ocellicauda TaxID=2972642 RepID=UPI003464C4D7